MRKYILGFGIAILIGVVAYSSFSNGKTKTMKAGGILGVNDIQADPSAYKGIITITGVMAGTSRQDPKVFAIVDTTEARACKSTGCARFYLSVRYEGPAPRVSDEVNVTGTFFEGGKVFIATKVEVLRHLNF
ncbi:MAG: hypothetical protein EHM36_10220 [Deltaproteobacteria bacterium]|nr:MAG: hypothetical protein EHM36_10220 [Deltaproteobacteria bacterium]